MNACARPVYSHCFLRFRQPFLGLARQIPTLQPVRLRPLEPQAMEAAKLEARQGQLELIPVALDSHRHRLVAEWLELAVLRALEAWERVVLLVQEQAVPVALDLAGLEVGHRAVGLPMRGRMFRSFMMRMLAMVRLRLIRRVLRRQ